MRVCELCEGAGALAKNFGVDSPGTPEIVTCPDCEGKGYIGPDDDDYGCEEWVVTFP